MVAEELSFNAVDLRDALQRRARILALHAALHPTVAADCLVAAIAPEAKRAAEAALLSNVALEAEAMEAFARRRRAMILVSTVDPQAMDAATSFNAEHAAVLIRAVEVALRVAVGDLHVRQELADKQAQRAEPWGMAVAESFSAERAIRPKFVAVRA